MMQLTQEQISILNSKGDMVINAVAGSGKTTTVIEYAKLQPAHCRLLYLAFNKAVKLQAMQRFAAGGLQNVAVETAHSLAFKYIIPGSKYKVNAKGYKTNELVQVLNLQVGAEKHAEYMVANHISKFASYFCNSDAQRIQALNYLDTVVDETAKAFVANNYAYIELQTRLFLAKMDKAEIPVTHDFYLKKFQLSQPKLPYQYILFDEGQDASMAMLDVFFQQPATKVIVGDTHQQIYGWRYAVNSLEKAPFAQFDLNTSFRFGESIASLAMQVLQWKKLVTQAPKVNMVGKGISKATKSLAVIARTNLGLLLKAIEYTTERRDIKRIYFEGNLSSYTYASEGASLYDVLNLYNQKTHLIKDSFIQQNKSLEELEEYVEKTEDVQLGMMIEMVKEYGNEIPSILQAIKDKHIDGDDKEQAQVIFSTVHRCKGMEYDTVELVHDFVTQEKLEKWKDNGEIQGNEARLLEEINLLYVAITRTTNKLRIPESLVPKNFAVGANIHVITKAPPISSTTDPKKIFPIKQKYQRPAVTEAEVSQAPAYTVETVRQTYKDAYKPWDAELDQELTIQYNERKTLTEMAAYFGRTKGAILSRIKKLELREMYGA